MQGFSVVSISRGDIVSQGRANVSKEVVESVDNFTRTGHRIITIHKLARKAGFLLFSKDAIDLSPNTFEIIFGMVKLVGVVSFFVEAYGGSKLVAIDFITLLISYSRISKKSFMQPIFEVTRAHNRLSNPWLGYLFSPNRFQSERKMRIIVRGEYRKESIISRVRVLSLIIITPIDVTETLFKGTDGSPINIP